MSNSPLLWYLLETISSVYNKVLKKKLINNERIYWHINIILIFSSPQNILINSIFCNITEVNIFKTFLLSLYKAILYGNSFKSLKSSFDSFFLLFISMLIFIFFVISFKSVLIQQVCVLDFFLLYIYFYDLLTFVFFLFLTTMLFLLLFFWIFLWCFLYFFC